MNTQHNIDDILARHFSEEPLSPEQQTVLEAYKDSHAEEYSKLKKLLDHLPGRLPQMSVDTQRAWQKIETRLARPIRKTPLLRLRPMLAIAASLLLIVGITLMAYHRLRPTEPKLYANSTTLEKNIQLPDGSQVTLSPATSIEYTEQGYDHSRKVTLRGKAFFNVTHNGQPFSVTAGDLQIDVLGTSFTVDATGTDSTIVSVQTGRVQVTKKGQTLILTKDEQAQLQRGNISKKKKKKPQPAEPVIFNFNDTPIAEAVQQVEYRMDVKIDVADNVSASNRITTRMQITSPMQAVREFALLCRCRYDSISPLRYALFR